MQIERKKEWLKLQSAETFDWKINAEIPAAENWVNGNIFIVEKPYYKKCH